MFQNQNMMPMTTNMVQAQQSSQITRPQTMAPNPNFSNNIQANQNYIAQRNNTYSVIPGRIVNRVEDIMPMEVPMDGTVALFPLADWSGICVKVWASDGQIKTFNFIPEEVSTFTAVEDNTQNKEVLERLDRIEEMLSKQQNFYKKSYNKKPYKPYNEEQKKEVTKNE